MNEGSVGDWGAVSPTRGQVVADMHKRVGVGGSLPIWEWVGAHRRNVVFDRTARTHQGRSRWVPMFVGDQLESDERFWPLHAEKGVC